ncbi:nitric oxide reductase activation protein [Scopulibacillus darangshiensis]|uniref:Nitric oxide reductase activation protein n=1 Tax=Scopulibacillus darangshiensis TaxID=442528 RepID=A0A4R2PA55_9BACL|nr:hypothetical protein [Scopulibacillus darangshiensis]TCP31248.1 nitric oxide reductase activation protein [Scopulibacillus darangshiensis]
MKFLDFMEKRVDPFLKIKLTDLAKTLAHSSSLEVDFAFHSYYKKDQDLVTVSHYWTRLLDNHSIDGMKSDIYLRAFGNAHFTDYHIVNDYFDKLKQMVTPSFRKQLFCLLEDIRIEEAALAKRPGMIHAFQARRDLFQRRFRERYNYHKERKEWLDVLFCAFYLQLIEKPTILPGAIAKYKPAMREVALHCRELPDTKAVEKAVQFFCEELSDDFGDMTASYFTMHEESHNQADDKSPSQKKNELASTTSKETEDKEEKDAHEEKMPTWQQEQEQEGDSMLQFDLDEGTKTDLIGEGERQGDSGDQAFAGVQGASRDSDGKNYDDQEGLDSGDKPIAKLSSSQSLGDANRRAKAIMKPRRKPTPEEIDVYKAIKADILPVQKPLQQSIKKAIEQKHTAPRTDLHFGRLNKKLLRVLTDDNPRLFYKKEEESNQWDAAFSLLVDCSASMFDKMDETKAGLTLFHETLRSLNIPHSVTGFWEDALSADDQEQPNTFYQVISYDRSLIPGQGPHMMQLEPEEDNRDGFAIRLAVRALVRRQEKRKVLLIFTDGEPSAFSYSENGIVDTHEAVIEARRRGIEVIGVFLSNGEPQEREKETMATIYGNQSLVIPTIADIPSYITPLLKKLLLKSL